MQYAFDSAFPRGRSVLYLDQFASVWNLSLVKPERLRHPPADLQVAQRDVRYPSTQRLNLGFEVKPLGAQPFQFHTGGSDAGLNLDLVRIKARPFLFDPPPIGFERCGVDLARQADGDRIHTVALGILPTPLALLFVTANLFLDLLDPVATRFGDCCLEAIARSPVFIAKTN